MIGDTSSICLTPDFEDSLYNRIHSLFVRIALTFPFFSLFKQSYIRQLFLLSNWPSDFNMLMKSTYCQTPQPLGYLPQFYLFQLLLCHFYHPLAAALIGLPTSFQTRFTLSLYLKFVFHLIHMFGEYLETGVTANFPLHPMLLSWWLPPFSNLPCWLLRTTPCCP